MTKKKAKKTASKTTAKKKGPGKKKKAKNPAEVREEISKMITADATEMAKAVIADGRAGQLASLKFLFEMAHIFPEPNDGVQATEEEDCLAKMLLDRLGPPVKTQTEEEMAEEAAAETAKVEAEAGDVGGEGAESSAVQRSEE